MLARAVLAPGNTTVRFLPQSVERAMQNDGAPAVFQYSAEYQLFCWAAVDNSENYHLCTWFVSDIGFSETDDMFLVAPPPCKTQTRLQLSDVWIPELIQILDKNHCVLVLRTFDGRSMSRVLVHLKRFSETAPWQCVLHTQYTKAAITSWRNTTQCDVCCVTLTTTPGIYKIWWRIVTPRAVSSPFGTTTEIAWNLTNDYCNVVTQCSYPRRLLFESNNEVDARTCVLVFSTGTTLPLCSYVGIDRVTGEIVFTRLFQQCLPCFATPVLWRRSGDRVILAAVSPSKGNYSIYELTSGNNECMWAYSLNDSPLPD